MARTKYTVTFPAAKAGDEVTWPNSVKVYADANIDRPMGNGYIEAAAGSFTGWSDAASVTFTRAGTDSVTVTAGSPTGTGAAVPSAASGGLTPTATKTANYTAVKGDLVPVDTTSGVITVTLPASPTAGDLVGVYKKTTDANAVTVAGTIDGQTNATISYPGSGALPGATFEFIGGSVGWKLIATYSTTGPAGPTGPTGATGPPGTNGPQAIQAAGYIGNWYEGNGWPSDGINNFGLGNGWSVMGLPVVAQETITIDQLGAYVVTGGTAGALLRFGIYTVSASAPWDLTFGSVYGTLLVDGGTVAATTNGARATVTLGSPQVITVGTAFAILVACQGTGGTVTIAASKYLGNSSPWGSSSSILNGVNLAVQLSGVTGALPGTYSPSGFPATGNGGAGWYHRSA